MVKKLEPVSDVYKESNIDETIKEQKSIFEKKPDKSLDKVNEVEITEDEREIITKICPHYYTLRDRYSEYKNYDDEGKNPIPLRIDRVHELMGFEATIAQADLSKDIDVVPTRLIKVFDFSETGERSTKLVVDKRVVGIDKEGRSTNISSVRTGVFKYPTQFEQKPDGDWQAVSNQMKKIYNIPFSKEEVLKFANVGNPFIKKYVVWHPDGARRGHFTLEDFINLTDNEQISLIEQGKR